MFTNLLTLLAAILAVVAFFPAAILCTQTVLALWPRKDRFRDVPEAQPDTVVLIPAHNERSRIRRTIRSVRKSNEDNVRVLVVADNCSDDTAEQAEAAGAEVVTRTDSTRLGKAYALGFGVQHLRRNPPEAVVVIDADAATGGAGLGRLAAIATQLQRPVQALNVIDRRRETADGHIVLATLGNRLHNVVRPLGYARLGFPCLLMGSGMAFPWEAVAQVDLANDALAEDKQLGIDLALAGYPPVFCLDTKVASHLTDDYSGYVGQRTRWEHGHVLSAITQIPKLISAAVLQGKWYLLPIALDLGVPPIAITAALWLAAFCASLTAAWLAAARWPLTLTLIASLLLLAVLGITWFAFARRRVPFTSLLGVPMYVLKKLPVYAKLLVSGPQRVWLRTNRTTID